MRSPWRPGGEAGDVARRGAAAGARLHRDWRVWPSGGPVRAAVPLPPAATLSPLSQGPARPGRARGEGRCLGGRWPGGADPVAPVPAPASPDRSADDAPEGPMASARVGDRELVPPAPRPTRGPGAAVGAGPPGQPWARPDGVNPGAAAAERWGRANCPGRPSPTGSVPWLAPRRAATPAGGDSGAGRRVTLVERAWWGEPSGDRPRGAARPLAPGVAALGQGGHRRRAPLQGCRPRELRPSGPSRLRRTSEGTVRGGRGVGRGTGRGRAGPAASPGGLTSSHGRLVPQYENENQIATSR